MLTISISSLWNKYTEVLVAWGWTANSLQYYADFQKCSTVTSPSNFLVYSETFFCYANALFKDNVCTKESNGRSFLRLDRWMKNSTECFAKHLALCEWQLMIAITKTICIITGDSVTNWRGCLLWNWSVSVQLHSGSKGCRKWIHSTQCFLRGTKWRWKVEGRKSCWGCKDSQRALDLCCWEDAHSTVSKLPKK